MEIKSESKFTYKFIYKCLLCVFLFSSHFTPLFAKNNNPVVSFTTHFGTIQIELFQDKDPVTVNNFIRYVKAGFYDKTIFHRIIDGFVLQGGGYDVAYQSKSPLFSSIVNQAKLGLKNEDMTIAMARKPNEPDGATSQFFINLASNPNLDYSSTEAGYAVFGKVTSGVDVVRRIARIKIGQKENLNYIPFYPQEALITKAVLFK